MLTVAQYKEIMALSNWNIWNDPHKHDLENKNFDHYYVENVYAKTPYGIIVLHARRVVNGASIPYLCQWFIPKSGKWNRPAGFHDVGYEDGGFWVVIMDENGNLIEKFIKLTQKEVDYAYLKLMQGRRVPKWNRNVQYRGLRLGGWVAWNKYRKLNLKIGA